MMSMSSPVIKVNRPSKHATDASEPRRIQLTPKGAVAREMLKVTPLMAKMNEKSSSLAPLGKKPQITVSSSLSDDRKAAPFFRENALRVSTFEESASRLKATPLKVCHASNVKILIEEPAVVTGPRFSINRPKDASKASTMDSLGVPQDSPTKTRSRLSSLLDEDQLLDQMIEQFGGRSQLLNAKISGTQLNMFRIVSRGGKKSGHSGQAPMSMNLDKTSTSSSNQPEKKATSSKNIPSVDDSLGEMLATKSLPYYYMNELFKLAVHFHKGKLPEDIESESLKEFWEHYRTSLHTLRGMSTDTLTDSKEFLKKLEIRYQLRLSEHDISPQTSVLEKPLLVLDLDETLIHKPVQGRVYREDASDLEMKCFIEKDPQGRYFTVYKRPYLQEFLQELAEQFTIYVFTASEQRYAAAIVNAIDPERKYIARVFDRRFCCATQGGYLVKDLRIFSRETPLNKILLVDNSSHCFFTQLKNGVPILSFYDQKEDRELLHLKRYLQALCRCENMLVRNEEHFQLDKYFTAGRPEVVLQKISSIKKMLQSGRQ